MDPGMSRPGCCSEGANGQRFACWLSRWAGARIKYAPRAPVGVGEMKPSVEDPFPFPGFEQPTKLKQCPNGLPDLGGIKPWNRAIRSRS